MLEVLFGAINDTAFVICYRLIWIQLYCDVKVFNGTVIIAFTEMKNAAAVVISLGKIWIQLYRLIKVFNGTARVAFLIVSHAAIVIGKGIIGGVITGSEWYSYLCDLYRIVILYDSRVIIILSVVISPRLVIDSDSEIIIDLLVVTRPGLVIDTFVIGYELVNFFPVHRCAVKIAFLIVSSGAIFISKDIIRGELYCFAILRNGTVKVAFLCINNTTIVIGICIARVEFNCFRVSFYCLVHLPEHEQDVTFLKCRFSTWFFFRGAGRRIHLRLHFVNGCSDTVHHILPTFGRILPFGNRFTFERKNLKIAELMRRPIAMLKDNRNNLCFIL